MSAFLLSAVNQLSIAGQGLAFASSSLDLCFSEKGLRKGRHHLSTVFFQTLGIDQAMGSASAASQLMIGKNIFSAPVKIVAHLTPIITAYAASIEFKKNHTFQKVTEFCYSHISTLIQLTNIVSLAVLFAHGHFVFASAALIHLSLRYLKVSKLITGQVLNLIHRVNFVTGTVANLYFGNWFACLYTVAYVAGFTFLKFSASYGHYETEEKISGSQVILASDLDSWVWITSLEINRNHYQKKICPEIPPDIQPDKIITCFATIEWDSDGVQKKCVDLMLERCPQWRESGDRDKKISDYLKPRLETLIKDILSSGNAQWIHALKYIAYRLSQKETDLQTKVDVFMNLAIPAGAYCPLAQKQIVLDQFWSLLSRDQDLPLEDRITLILQMDREFAFTENLEYFAADEVLGFAVRYLKTLNVHWQAEVHRVLKAGLGWPILFNQETEEELASMKGAAKLGGSPILTRFHTMYGERRVLKAIKSAIGTPLLPTRELDRWFDEWLTKMGMDESSIKTFKEQNQKYNKETQTIQMDDKLLRMMLVTMGVLKKPEIRRSEPDVDSEADVLDELDEEIE